jgi:hypothetical protein
MALNTQIAIATANAEANTFAALCNSGVCKVYDGTQPATSDTAIGAQVLGVTLTLNATAFGTPVNGLLTANAITGGVAVAGITPTWFRLFKSDGTTVVMDGSVGTSASNMILGAFTSGTTVTCSSFTHNVRLSTSGL